MRELSDGYYVKRMACHPERSEGTQAIAQFLKLKSINGNETEIPPAALPAAGRSGCQSNAGGFEIPP